MDPPYNTGGDSFNYNDSFNHSTWLTFLKNRLEIAKELLSNDGAIYMQLDYNEIHYGKILMDEVFGRENFQREIIWDVTVLSGFKTIANNWIRGHETILYYSKSEKPQFNKLYQEHTQEYLSTFKKKDPDGRMYMVAHGLKRYLDRVEEKGKPFGDVWNDVASFQQIPTAKERLNFSTQKTEKLLSRIIQASSNEGDIVLDFFAGSGTTLVVAHKLKRHWIGIEQIDSQMDIFIKRIQSVIKGGDEGISKDVNWKGGGAFAYMELKQWNETYMQAIQEAKVTKELAAIYKKMQGEAFFRYEIDLNKFDQKHFGQLDFNDQKKVLLECLDKNHLYVNYSEIDDATYKIPTDEKKINKAFYGN